MIRVDLYMMCSYSVRGSLGSYLFRRNFELSHIAATVVQEKNSLPPLGNGSVSCSCASSGVHCAVGRYAYTHESREYTRY